MDTLLNTRTDTRNDPINEGKKEKRGVYYTSLMGYYDNLRKPRVEGEFLCFSNRRPEPSYSWNVQTVQIQRSAAVEVRKYKCQPHLYIKHDITIYVDANFEINIPFDRAVDEFLGDSDIAVHRHPERNCIYREARVCAAWHKATMDEMRLQMEAYKAEGYPEDNGLYECGILIRRNTERIKRLNEMWFGEVEKHSARDQVSFPVCLWRLGIEPKIIPGMAQANSNWKWTAHTNP